MSEGDSPRAVSNVYYTQSVARAAVQRDSDSGEEEAVSPVRYERLSPGKFEEIVIEERRGEEAVVQASRERLVRHRATFAPIASAVAQAARRRLIYNPPAQPAVLIPGRMAVPPNLITNLKVKFATFKGSEKQDPDCHIAQFEIKWGAGGYDQVYGDAEKLAQFKATLEGKAVEWLNGFAANTFPDYVSLRNAFLRRF